MCEQVDRSVMLCFHQKNSLRRFQVLITGLFYARTVPIGGLVIAVHKMCDQEDYGKQNSRIVCTTTNTLI